MPQALRTATPMGDWRSLKFTAGVDTPGAVVGIKDAVAAGTSFLYQIGDTIGAVLESAAVGAQAVLIYHAEKIMVPKMVGAGQNFGVGTRVYFDPVTRLTTPVIAVDDWWIGIATEPALTTDVYVEIDLKGDRAENEAALV